MNATEQKLTNLERAALNLAIYDSINKPMIQIEDVNGEYCRAYSELLLEAEKILQSIFDENVRCAQEQRSTSPSSSSGSSGSSGTPSHGATGGSNTGAKS